MTKKLLFIIVFLLSIGLVSAAGNRLWWVEDQLNVASMSENYFEVNPTTFWSFINGSYISSSVNSIAINITCPTSTAGKITASFCQALDQEYEWDCDNSTRVNVTKNGLPQISCPQNTWVMSDNLSITFDPANNYIYQRNVSATVDVFIRWRDSVPSKRFFGYLEGSNFAQTNPDGSGISNGDDLNDVYAIYDSGLPTNPPNLWFKNQTPENITLDNVMDKNLTIWYNASTDQTLDIDTAVLFYKTNTTTLDYAIFVNGTQQDDYSKRKNSSNDGLNIRFDLDDIIYPATYNLDHELFEDEPHLDTEMSLSQHWRKVELYNVSGQTNITIIEAMVNSTNLLGGLEFYYCNSSYSTGNPSGTDSCTEIFVLDPLQDFNHSHSSVSFHHLIPVVIIDQKVNNLTFVTSLSYIAMSPVVNTGSWFASYIANKARATAFETSTNNGVTWTEISGTMDLHLHQHNDSDRLYYFACINDTDTNENCSSPRINTFAGISLPPSSPNVNNPVADLYNNEIRINYTASQSQSSTIDHYNISLHTLAGVIVQTISANNQQNLNFTWDTNLASDGNYTVHVTAVDIDGLSAFGVSAEFEIDNTNPSINIIQPTNGAIYINDSTRFTFICSDDNLFGYDLHIFNSSEYVLSNSSRNLSTTVFQLNITFNLSNYSDGDYTFAASCLDGHTAQFVKYENIEADETGITVDQFTLKSTAMEKVEYNEKFDRVSYEFKYNEQGIHYIDVKSQHKIWYLRDSIYRGHFITAGNWLDFEPVTPLSVSRVSDYHYIVEVEGKEFYFDSIGDLNNQTQQNTFTIMRDVQISTQWDSLNPPNNTQFYNVTSFEFEFNYSNSVGNDSICTIYRNNTNLSSSQFSTGINNISSGTVATTVNATHEYYVFCNAYAEGLTGNSSIKYISFQNTAHSTIDPAFTITECPSTVALALMFGLMVAIAFFLVVMAIIFRLAFLGIMGSLMMFVVSWYFAACIALFSTLFIGVSLLLLIYFVFTGLALGFATIKK